MRTRSKATVDGQTFDTTPVVGVYRTTYFWSTSGQWQELGSTPIEYRTLTADEEPLIGVYLSTLYQEKEVSLMKDIPGGWSLGGYKPVDHQKIYWKIAPESPSVTGWRMNSDPYWYNGKWHYDRVTYLLPHNDLAACHLIKRLQDEEDWQQTEIDVQQALQIAYDISRPRAEDLSQGFQGAVFFAELRDATRIIRSLKQSKRMLTSLRYNLTRKNLGENFSEFHESFIKLGADAHLTWAYAVEPFLNDLQNLWTVLYGVDAYISAWNRDAKNNTWRLRHVDITEFIDGLSPSSTTNRVTTFSTGSNWETEFPSGMEIDSIDMTIAEQVKREAKVIYTLAFVPGNIDDLSKRWGRDYAKFAMRFDALGLGDPAEIVWNLIPFSFLIDYVSTAQEFFEQFGADLYQMPIADMGGGFSIKKTSIISHSATSKYSDSYAAGRMTTYQRHAVDTFGRPVGEQYEVQGARFSWEWPSLKQMSRVISLIASLIYDYHK